MDGPLLQRAPGWWARAAPADRYSAQVASVPYSRASMYTGLPDVLAPVLDGIIAQRLAPSSARRLLMLRHPTVPRPLLLVDRPPVLRRLLPPPLQHMIIIF